MMPRDLTVHVVSGVRRYDWHLEERRRVATMRERLARQTSEREWAEARTMHAKARGDDLPLFAE